LGLFRFVIIKDVDLNGSIAIVGFPGMGLVGKFTAEYFIRNFRSELIGKVIGYGFPSQLLVTKGIGSLITLDIYHVKINDKKLLIITSATQPTNHWEQHELAEIVTKNLAEKGVKTLFAAAAFVGDMVTESKTRKIYIASGSEELANKLFKYGAIPINDGVISGLNGIIVGWAQLYGIESACILGETWRAIVDMGLTDYRAAKTVIEFIAKILGIKVETKDLDKNADEVEENIKKMYAEWLVKARGRREAVEKREVPYTM